MEEILQVYVNFLLYFFCLLLLCVCCLWVLLLFFFVVLFLLLRPTKLNQRKPFVYWHHQDLFDPSLFASYHHVLRNMVGAPPHNEKKERTNISRFKPLKANIILGRSSGPSPKIMPFKSNGNEIY